MWFSHVKWSTGELLAAVCSLQTLTDNTSSRISKEVSLWRLKLDPYLKFSLNLDHFHCGKLHLLKELLSIPLVLNIDQVIAYFWMMYLVAQIVEMSSPVSHVLVSLCLRLHSRRLSWSLSRLLFKLDCNSTWQQLPSCFSAELLPPETLFASLAQATEMSF